MAKSRSKISRQPVKKSKKPAARKSAPAKTAAKTAPKGKWVYSFGGGKAAGRAGMRNLLGGKGLHRAQPRTGSHFRIDFTKALVLKTMFGHGCFDHARRDCVTTNALRSILSRNMHGERSQAALAAE